MSLAKAKAIGRKPRRMGRLWPMPIRETDLGHIYVEITVRPLAGSRKSWKGMALVDTGATDTFLPAEVLRKLGIQPSATRSYELADGSEQDSLDFACTSPTRKRGWRGNASLAVTLADASGLCGAW